MKKLFLTSFVFTTGGIEYKEHRLVVVSKESTREFHHNKFNSIPPQHALNYAYAIAEKWFKLNFPESKIISLIVHPAIE